MTKTLIASTIALTGAAACTTPGINYEAKLMPESLAAAETRTVQVDRFRGPAGGWYARQFENMILQTRYLTARPGSPLRTSLMACQAKRQPAPIADMSISMIMTGMSIIVPRANVSNGTACLIARPALMLKSFALKSVFRSVCIRVSSMPIPARSSFPAHMAGPLGVNLVSKPVFLGGSRRSPPFASSWKRWKRLGGG